MRHGGRRGGRRFGSARSDSSPRPLLPVPPAGGWRLGIRDPDAVGAARTAARTDESRARHAEKEGERRGRVAALMVDIKARGEAPLGGGEKVLKGQLEQLARAP